MFGLLKKKYELIAPLSGKVLDLSKSEDPVFSGRLTGDGVLIDPTSDIAVAPADGTLSMVFKTNHAFGMTLENGIELLVHIGMDTVELLGEGFERLAEEGTFVKKGTPIIKIDVAFIKSHGKQLLTPVIITTPSELKDLTCNIDSTVKGGKDVILTYKL
jgi:PTS system D-glucosamine-specific IIA component/PTS system glucose-specific IIA component